MSRWLFAAVAVLVGLVSMSQVPSFAQSVDPTLQKAIDDRRAARQKKDIAVWEQLTSSDAMEIHSDGRIHTRAEESAEIKAAATIPPDIPDTDKKIRVFGSTAVYTYQRNPKEGPRRTTTVWVKAANGQWQCVLTQQTAVAKK